MDEVRRKTVEDNDMISGIQQIWRRSSFSSSDNWWLRSANADDSNNVANVNNDGNVNNNNANNNNCLSPDCIADNILYMHANEKVSHMRNSSLTEMTRA